MALRVAVATGNWSNPAIWNGGVLPSPGDIVASNNFIVTIDQNVNVDTLTNASRSIVNAIPTMTSDTTPSGVASGFFTNGGATHYKAFDKDVNNNFFAGVIVAGDYIQYEFANPIAIDQFAIQFGGNTVTSMSLQGWNGSSWVNLLTTSSTNVSFFTTGLAGNSTTYNRYRVVFNTAMYIQLREVYFYEYLGTTASVAGGGFTLNNGVSATATNGFYNGASVQLVTFSLGSGQSASMIGNLYSGLVAGSASIGGVVAMNGVGTLNIIGTLYSGGSTNAEALKINSAGTINITGNIEDNNSNVTRQVIIFFAAATINLTGNIISSTTSGGTTIAGTLVNGQGNSFKLYITGNVLSSLNSCIGSSGASYMSIVGTIQTIKNTVNNGAALAVASTNGGATNIFSGPFICSEYGVFPYQVARMHLIPSASNYIEFRDETTNGAVSPGAIAPATRMIAPAGVSDSPIPANVRFGTVYANGSLTGTLKMPNPNSVAYGVQVDNTIGNAVLTPQSVWDFAIASLNTSGSIGERLKKVATVDSTGAQLSSFEF
jgi:hypothetical protein